MKAGLLTNYGRPSLTGPGKLARVDLNSYRRGKRVQELAFQMAKELTREYKSHPDCEASPLVLFPQLARIVDHYLRTKVIRIYPAELVDIFLAPYYGWVIERLLNAIKPDTGAGEAPEVPVYEKNHEAGSTADVNFWTSNSSPMRRHDPRMARCVTTRHMAVGSHREGA